MGGICGRKPCSKLIDYQTGKIRWSHDFPGRGAAGSGILSTAGKLAVQRRSVRQSHRLGPGRRKDSLALSSRFARQQWPDDL